MTRIGCVILVFLIVALCTLGVSTASRHDHSAWLGLALGAIAWLAVVGGWMACLTIFDWINRHKKREGVPWWVIPMIWVFFVGAATVTVTLYRHVIRV